MTFNKIMGIRSCFFQYGCNFIQPNFLTVKKFCTVSLKFQVNGNAYSLFCIKNIKRIVRQYCARFIHGRNDISFVICRRIFCKKRNCPLQSDLITVFIQKSLINSIFYNKSITNFFAYNNSSIMLSLCTLKRRVSM